MAELKTQGAQLIFKKMIDIMNEIGPVSKDQKNVAQGFKFRGIDQFVNALHPALAKHKVFMAPRCISETHELREVTRSNGKPGLDKHVHMLMEYTFYAEDGSNVVIGPIPSEGLDSGDKATTKALSAALKYTLIQTFCIATEDMAEADLDSPEIQQPYSNPRPAPVQAQKVQPQVYAQKVEDRKPSEAQLKRLFAISKQSNTSHEQVKAYIFNQWGHQSSKDLSLSEYDQIIDLISAEGLPPAPSAAAAASTEEKSSVVDEKPTQWFKNRTTDERMVK